MGLYVNNSGVLSPIAGTPTAILNGLQDQIDDAVYIQSKNGAKNLLPNNFPTTQEVNGITYAVNSDGSITANGTASTWATANSMAVITLEPGNYRFWFNRDDYYLFGRNGGTTTSHPVVFDALDEGYFTLDTTTTLYVGVTASPDTVLTNEVLYPMIWCAEDSDDTYVPYAMTNKQLTDTLSETSSKADSAYSTAALSAYIAEGNSSLDVEILPWAIYFMTVGASGGGGSRFLTAAYYMVAVADNPTHAVVASKIGGSDAMEFTGTFTYKSNNIYTVTNPSGRRIQFWKLGIVTQ